MLTFLNRRNLGASVARSAALCLLALAATLLGARDARAQWTTSGTNTTTTNNVGVGTTTPEGILDVGDTDIRLRVATTDLTDKYGLRVGDAGRKVVISSERGTSQQALVFGDTTLGNVFGIGTSGDTGATWNSRFVVHQTGNVGVGTNAPQSLLDISGSSGMTLRTSAASSGFSFFDRPSVPGDQVVFQGNKGNYSLFNVSTRGANIGTEKGSGMAFWTVDIANTANATQFQMHYSHLYGPIFFTQKFGTGAQGDKKISFQTAWQNTAVAPTQLVLDTSGNVGIGTATPVSKLHVAGDITVAGNINAKYQDLAEWVPSVEKLAPATVVILDVARDNHVAASSSSYDTRVAGVISAQPGISLGEAGAGKVLVATTGRVKVRVDATQGPIKVGDLLVTSDRQGYAMKSEPVLFGKRQMHAPGTIIGKALESLAGGTGEILVLLSLQ